MEADIGFGVPLSAIPRIANEGVVMVGWGSAVLVSHVFPLL